MKIPFEIGNDPMTYIVETEADHKPQRNFSHLKNEAQRGRTV